MARDLPKTSKRIRRPKREAVRSRLVDEAIAAFERKGYAAANLSDIAEDAGFSRGAVYSNFSGKEDLFLAALEKNAADRMEKLFTGPDLRAALLKPVKVGVQPAVWALLFIEFCISVKDSPDLLARLRQTRQRMRQRLGDKLIERGACGKTEARAVAAVLVAVNNGLLIEQLCDPALAGELNKTVLPKLADCLLKPAR